MRREGTCSLSSFLYMREVKAFWNTHNSAKHYNGKKSSFLYRRFNCFLYFCIAFLAVYQMQRPAKKYLLNGVCLTLVSWRLGTSRVSRSSQRASWCGCPSFKKYIQYYSKDYALDRGRFASCPLIPDGKAKHSLRVGQATGTVPCFSVLFDMRNTGSCCWRRQSGKEGIKTRDGFRTADFAVFPSESWKGIINRSPLW